MSLGGSLALTMCGGGGGETGTGTTETTCPNGICGPASSSSGMTNTGGAGGMMTSSSSGMGGAAVSSSSGGGGSTTVSSSGTTSSTTSSTSSGGCVESWLCTPWDTGNGTPSNTVNSATRTCTDTHNCGTTNNKPATQATLPALDVNYFECKIEPILDRKCSMLACHGTETGRALRVYARARLREATAVITAAQCPGSMTGTQCTGSDSCPCNGNHSQKEWQRNFDAARGFALDDNGNALPDQSQSDLIRQPVVGGKSHAGIHLFKMSDPEYATLLNWLSGTATLASCDPGAN
ncbi:MAG: hypothetical protein QM820_02435 [Minicystis sp.]